MGRGGFPYRPQRSELTGYFPKTVFIRLWASPVSPTSPTLFLRTLLGLQTLGMRQLTFAYRARALQCLLYLADKDTVESLFKKPMKEVK